MPGRRGFVPLFVIGLLVGACSASSAPAFTFEPVTPASRVPSASPSPRPSPSPSPRPSPSPSPSSSPSPSPSRSPGLSPSPAASSATKDTWLVVAVGDSIVANRQVDCPGCTGFVAQYARRLAADTDHPTKVRNLGVGGLQTDALLAEVRSDATRRAALRASDVVLVSIGTNDGPWRHTDDPCDGKVTLDSSTAVLRAAFAKYDETCARAYAEAYRSRLDRIFSTIVALRNGRPGILIALNRYNDWLGMPTSKLAVADDLARVSPMIVAAWNRVYCDVARKNGFRCADLSTLFNGPDGTRPSGDLVVADFTHPSQLGMNAITNLLVKLGYKPLYP